MQLKWIDSIGILMTNLFFITIILSWKKDFFIDFIPDKSWRINEYVKMGLPFRVVYKPTSYIVRSLNVLHEF